MRVATAVGWLGLAATIAGSAAADVETVDLDGRRVRGQWAALDVAAGTLTLTVDGASRVLVLGQQVEIVNLGRAAAGPVDVEVELRTGELVRGRLEHATTDVELPVVSAIGRFVVDLGAHAHPAWIRFVGEGVTAPSDLSGVDDARDAFFGRDGRLIAQGDVDGFAGDKVLLVSKESGQVTRAFAQLGAIRFARGETPPAGAGLRAMVEAVDGSVLLGRLEGFVAGQVTLVSASGRRLAVPMAGVAKLSLSGGGFDYLSDVAPVAIEEIPHVFDAKVARAAPFAPGTVQNFHVDRAYPGDAPLRLGGASHRKGLGLHSWVSVTWALEGRYRRLTGQLGIDDGVMDLSGDVAERGSVIVRVIVDGAEKARYPQQGFLAGGTPPVEVRVELRDARQLTLVVDYAGNPGPPDYADTHIRDRVAFVAARLVK